MMLVADDAEIIVTLDAALLIDSDVIEILLVLDTIPVDVSDSKEALVLGITLVDTTDTVCIIPSLDCEPAICSMFELILTEDGSKEDTDILPADVEVTTIDCTDEECSLLDVIFMLLTDDMDINVLSDNEPLTVINGREVCSLLVIVLVDTTDVELKFSLLLTSVMADVADSKLLDSIPVNAIDGVGASLVALKGVTDKVEVRLPVDVMVTVVTDGTKFSLLLDDVLLDITDDSSLLGNVLIEVMYILEDKSLLDIVLSSPIDDPESSPLLDMTLAVDDVEITALLDAILLIIIDVAEILLVFDTVPVDITDNKLADVTDGTGIGLLFSLTPVYVIDGVGVCSVSLLDCTVVILPIDVAVRAEIDGTKFGSLLDDVSLDVTDNVLVDVLLGKISMEATDNVEDDLVFKMDSSIVDGTDDEEISILLDTTPLDTGDNEGVNKKLLESDDNDTEICSLAITTGIVDLEFNSLLIAILIEVTVCRGVSSMFDTTVVDVTNAVDVILLFDTVMIAVIDCKVEDRSLLDILLTLLTDDAVTEAIAVIKGREVWSLLDIALVEYISLFVALLVDVTVFTEVTISSLFDVTLVEVADAGKISSLLDNLLVAVINCVIEGCSLLDIISICILLTDRLSVDINVLLSNTEPLAVINGREVGLLLNVALVGTTDVELSSLLATSIAEVTVCAEFSSLLDIALVDVLGMFDILLAIDGTDICSALTEVMDDVIADLLVDAAVVEITNVAVVGLLDNKLISSLLDITLVDVTDNPDTNLLLDGELVNFMETTSLLETVSTEVVDDETGIDDAGICLLAVLTGVVVFSPLFVVVLVVKATICIGVSSIFDAAVVEVTADTVDNIVALLDTTPTTDSDVMEVTLVLDAILVVVMLDTALVDVTDGVVVETLVNKLICSLFDIIPVDTSDDIDVN